MGLVESLYREYGEICALCQHFQVEGQNLDLWSKAQKIVGEVDSAQMGDEQSLEDTDPRELAVLAFYGKCGLSTLGMMASFECMDREAEGGLSQFILKRD